MVSSFKHQPYHSVSYRSVTTTATTTSCCNREACVLLPASGLTAGLPLQQEINTIASGCCRSRVLLSGTFLPPAAAAARTAKKLERANELNPPRVLPARQNLDWIRVVACDSVHRVSIIQQTCLQIYSTLKWCLGRGLFLKHDNWTMWSVSKTTKQSSGTHLKQKQAPATLGAKRLSWLEEFAHRSRCGFYLFIGFSDAWGVAQDSYACSA